MLYLKTSFGEISTFSICQAHLQLEADYNKGGWLRERPSNGRRMEATACQLNRMQYKNPYGWVDITKEPAQGDDPDDEDVRTVYVVNVLKWQLPIADDLATVARRLVAADCLHGLRPDIFAEA